MFNEYPKGLYKGGVEDGENVIAFDAEQEAEYRKQGYKMLNEPQEKSPALVTQKKEKKAKPKEEVKPASFMDKIKKVLS
jgi:hypothetical protein